MRFRGRVDLNQKEIVTGLRAAGCSVLSLANIGSNAPDLLVGCRGITYLLEVKNPETLKKIDRPKVERQKNQTRWHEAWAGNPPAFVETVEQALRAVGL